MKRIISSLLAVILLVSAWSSVAVFAADDTSGTSTSPTFTVSSEQSSRGKTVSVTIRMDGNPGIASIKLKASFDKALTLNSITYNEALGGVSQQPQTFTSPVTLNWINGEANTVGDMVYAVLNFTVSKSASVGNHAVTITYDEDDVYNIAGQNVDFAIINGGVNVVIPVTGLALDPSEATVHTGDGTVTLTPVFTPSNATNKKVTWKSSDKTVATVKNGVVTLLKKGETAITATSSDGGFKATCALTVLCSHLDCEEIPAEASTCIKQGHDAYTVCKDCGEIVSGSDALLPLAAHHYVKNADPQYLKSAATCSKAAVYYKSCSVCGRKSTSTFTYGDVDPDNHVGGTHIEHQENASCSKAGYTGDVVCDSCGTVLTPGSEIAQLEHTPAAPVRENEVAVSCETDGGYDEVVYCTSCDDELSREHTTIPATGHSYGKPKWTWKGYESAAASFTCSKCGDVKKVNATITSEVTKEPSSEEAGECKHTATVTFKGKTYTNTKTEILPRWILLGDVDNDGEVTIFDATAIQRHLANLPTKTYVEEAGDCDGDGEVSIFDATAIQRFLAGLPTYENIGKYIT